MRYIDADVLKDNFCNACATLKRYKRTVDGCRSYTDTYGNQCFKMRLIDATPTADVAPKSEVEALEKEVINKAKSILSDFKKEIHDRAVYPNCHGVEPYISLKVFDAVINKLIGS